jgi:Inovirus Coat protein B
VKKPFLLLTVISPSAFAAGVDVSTVVTFITDQILPIGLIGGAVLLVTVAIKAYQWLKQSLFGGTMNQAESDAYWRNH